MLGAFLEWDETRGETKEMLVLPRVVRKGRDVEVKAEVLSMDSDKIREIDTEDWTRSYL